MCGGKKWRFVNNVNKSVKEGIFFEPSLFYGIMRALKHMYACCFAT